MPYRDWQIWLIRDRTSRRIVGELSVGIDLLAPGVFHLGFFIIESARQGSGLAARVHAAYEAGPSAQGARWLRLGVVACEYARRSILAATGYIEVRRREGYALGSLTHQLIVMVKPVPPNTLADFLLAVPRPTRPVKVVARATGPGTAATAMPPPQIARIRRLHAATRRYAPRGPGRSGRNRCDRAACRAAAAPASRRDGAIRITLASQSCWRGRARHAQGFVEPSRRHPGHEVRIQHQSGCRPVRPEQVVVDQAAIPVVAWWSAADFAHGLADQRYRTRRQQRVLAVRINQSRPLRSRTDRRCGVPIARPCWNTTRRICAARRCRPMALSTAARANALRLPLSREPRDKAVITDSETPSRGVRLAPSVTACATARQVAATSARDGRGG